MEVGWGRGQGRGWVLSLVVTFTCGGVTNCSLPAPIHLELSPPTSCPEPRLLAILGRVEGKAHV